MLRSIKGGTGLRILIDVTAMLVIAAGVYAGHRSKPSVGACAIVPTSIFEGRVVQVTCTGLSSSTQYTMISDGAALWNTSGLGSGDGSSAANAAGLSSPHAFTTNVLGLATMYFNTTDSGTVALTGLHLLEYSTNSVPAYDLSFTVDQAPLCMDPERLQVSGLIGSETIKVGPMDETNETPDLNGWQDSGSGSVSGSGTSGSPYLFPNSFPYSFSLSASSGAIDTYVQTNNGTMSTISTRLAVFDNSGTLIGISPQIDVESCSQ